MSDRRTDDATLIEAVRILSRTIKSDDGVIPACLAEAAARLETLVEAIYRAGTFMPSEAPKGQNCTERDNCAAPAASGAAGTEAAGTELPTE